MLLQYSIELQEWEKIAAWTYNSYYTE